MQKGHVLNKAGYDKIRKSCHQAAADGHTYIWVDTCCIDKSSSAELSEAINSIYRWYHNAQTCYVYLADVPSDVDIQSKESAFAKSRWFTRGWTLQELIAPSDLVFFSMEWDKICEKWKLRDVISQITGVDTRILGGEHPCTMSVAQRMSWASRRKTTRVEDLAYCLMGIFDVNMPLLYGEREKSFIRLQEEIMKSSDDHSLFAWRYTQGAAYSGLLAESPACFAESDHIVPFRNWNASSPYSMTNTGLRIDMDLLPSDEGEDVYLAALNCEYHGIFGNQPGIYLKRLAPRANQWVRIRAWELVSLIVAKLHHEALRESIFVRQWVREFGPWMSPDSQSTTPLRRRRQSHI